MKVIVWLIVIAAVLLVAYAIATGLPGDVVDPFDPPSGRSF